MSSHKYDFLFKLLIIGESGVGKTCLLLRFTDDSFTQNHLTTIGIDFKIKIINIEDKLIKLQIWDTAGQERFRTITKTYYKGAHGIILTYDVTDQNSFKNIRNWIKQIEANAQTSVKKVLVGNKCDKPDRVVTEEEGKKLADDYSMSFFETSAKTNQNVNERVLFNETGYKGKFKKFLADQNLNENDQLEVCCNIYYDPWKSKDNFIQCICDVDENIEPEFQVEDEEIIDVFKVKIKDLIQFITEKVQNENYAISAELYMFACGMFWSEKLKSVNINFNN